MVDYIGVVLQSGLLQIGLPMLLILAGIALVVMEALAPGAHFIVIGVAVLLAGIVGLVGSTVGLGFLALPLALGVMVLLFGAITFYAYREFDLYGGESQAQTSDSDSLKGATARVTERVTETEGEVKVENGGFNPYYRARSLDGEIAEGEEVIVVDPGGGNVLTVMSMEEPGVTDQIDRELERARTESEPEEETDVETG
jgi:membrane protein implicated in regulation of membrane protease activity